MCLLVMVLRVDREIGLMVGANRDERMERPAVAITVLQERAPRILGGRDLVAGGTWLAVNEHGVVAGLTNTPTSEGRDPTKRSRGVLPLVAARARTAAEAVALLAESISPAEFNPAWMLVGDRTSLFAVTVAGSQPDAVQLAPGLHVLENRPPGSASAKVEHVTGLVGATEGTPSSTLRRRLMCVLADHTTPTPGYPEARGGVGSTTRTGGVASPEQDRGASAGARPLQLLAACVHAPHMDYGTRSSVLVSVPSDPTALPLVGVADGPPCEAPFVDCTHCWADPASEGLR